MFFFEKKNQETYGCAVADLPGEHPTGNKSFLTLPFKKELLSFLPPERRLMAVQFARFAVVGTLGFVWDFLIVSLLAPHLGPYWAGLVSYVIAASINWLLNRVWTYRDRVHAPMRKQWPLFLAANSVGLVLNRGTYSALIAFVPLCRAHLIIPVAAGGLCGMFVNFFLSRRLVFR
jgi:putative flippase GtrA